MLAAVGLHLGFLGVAWVLTVAMLAAFRAAASRAFRPVGATRHSVVTGGADAPSADRRAAGDRSCL